MLVLSRQRDQKIVLGETIVITIVEIRGDKVRIGIDAPKELPVHRAEVYTKITGRTADELIGQSRAGRAANSLDGGAAEV